MGFIFRIRSLAERWRRDTRGTSMVTTAVTLPLLIVILFGIWYIFWWLMVKQALHNGVADAARQATEFGRYWNIDPTGGSDVDGDLLPVDFYEIEARRMIENRLRDISNWPSATLAFSTCSCNSSLSRRASGASLATVSPSFTRISATLPLVVQFRSALSTGTTFASAITVLSSDTASATGAACGSVACVFIRPRPKAT